MAKDKADQLRAYFEEIDVRKTGMISVDELKLALRKQLNPEDRRNKEKRQ